MSPRLVAANTITFVLVPKPSISVSSWFSVFSRSSLLPEKLFLPLARPIASISSIKIIQGALSLACLNRSRTREAPTPTNISTKSEPDREKKGTCASPATALANRVLPVPGEPTSNAPFGIFPPRLVYFFGFFRKSTISITSCFASSKPATSLKVTDVWVSLSNKVALDLPILKIWPPAPPPPPIRLMMKIQKNRINNSGSIRENNHPVQALVRSSNLTDTCSPFSISSWAAFSFLSNASKEPSVNVYCGPVAGDIDKELLVGLTSLYFSSVSRSFLIKTSTNSKSLRL